MVDIVRAYGRLFHDGAVMRLEICLQCRWPDKIYEAGRTLSYSGHDQKKGLQKNYTYVYLARLPQHAAHTPLFTSTLEH